MGGEVGDFVALLKPRVMSLVVFTAAAGMFVAPGSLHPLVAAIAILCIAVGAGASGALNMWYDADIDAIMSRTRNRPIPAGHLDRQTALMFGLVLAVFSVAFLGLATNWFAAGFLAFTIFFYAVIYTMWLKRATPQNIVIGGAAGAFPPMVGWAAVTGNISLDSIVLFLIIFLWTPPHFWALALYKQSDYAAAGIPMMPNVAGERSTRNQILAYSLVLSVSALLPLVTGLTGWVYAVPAIALSATFSGLAVQLWRAPADRMKHKARELFTFSLLYLFGIFLALAADVGIARWLEMIS
ncbi:MAG: protoheme IX farnesyltransferase [Hyphomicrobiaceae bacterium]|nr:protoheme IX farnesyltransferase [Hyphomicrobiaceae bacterium]